MLSSRMNGQFSPTASSSTQNTSHYVLLCSRHTSFSPLIVVNNDTKLLPHLELLCQTLLILPDAPLLSDWAILGLTLGLKWDKMTHNASQLILTVRLTAKRPVTHTHTHSSVFISTITHWHTQWEDCCVKPVHQASSSGTWWAHVTLALPPCLPACLTDWMTVRLSDCLSVWLTDWLTDCLSVCLSAAHLHSYRLQDKEHLIHTYDILCRAVNVARIRYF